MKLRKDIIFSLVIILFSLAVLNACGEKVKKENKQNISFFVQDKNDMKTNDRASEGLGKILQTKLQKLLARRKEKGK